MFEVEVYTGCGLEDYADQRETFVDLIEAMVGRTFSEELDRVEVRLRYFHETDDRKAEWLVRIIADENDLKHLNVKTCTEAFHSEFRGLLREHVGDYPQSSTIRVIPVMGGVVSERWN